MHEIGNARLELDHNYYCLWKTKLRCNLVEATFAWCQWVFCRYWLKVGGEGCSKRDLEWMGEWESHQ